MDSSTTFTLELIKVAVTQAVDEKLICANVDWLPDHMAGRFIMQVDGFLLGERMPEKTIRHPADWWQAFKARWFPAWALRRWPAIESVHHIRFSVIYPDFRPPIPLDGYHRVVTLDHWRDYAEANLS